MRCSHKIKTHQHSTMSKKNWRCPVLQLVVLQCLAHTVLQAKDETNELNRYINRDEVVMHVDSPIFGFSVAVAVLLCLIAALLHRTLARETERPLASVEHCCTGHWPDRRNDPNKQELQMKKKSNMKLVVVQTTPWKSYKRIRKPTKIRILTKNTRRSKGIRY